MEKEKESTKLDVWYRPDWHPSLNGIFGDLKNQYGYVSEVGTIRLLGPIAKEISFSRFKENSEIEGPVTSISAVPSLGIL